MSMGEGVVIVVSGGMVQGVASNMDIEVTLVDWDNIQVGDKRPQLPEGMQYNRTDSVEVGEKADVKQWKWLDF